MLRWQKCPTMHSSSDSRRADNGERRPRNLCDTDGKDNGQAPQIPGGGEVWRWLPWLPPRAPSRLNVLQFDPNLHLTKEAEFGLTERGGVGPVLLPDRDRRRTWTWFILMSRITGVAFGSAVCPARLCDWTEPDRLASCHVEGLIDPRVASASDVNAPPQVRRPPVCINRP